MKMKIDSPDFITSNIFVDEVSNYWWDDNDNMVISLQSTDPLIELVDRYREEKGLLPIAPTDNHTDDYDEDTWYNYYVNISEKDGLLIAPKYIDVYVDGIYAEDSNIEYQIELSDEASNMLFKQVDEQTKAYWGDDLKDFYTILLLPFP